MTARTAEGARMNRPGPATRSALRRWALGAALPLAAGGCADLPQWPTADPPPVVRAVAPPEVKPAVLPPVPQLEAAAPLPAPATVPVSLDAVLRIAEEQNPSVALARERVCEAYAEQELAAKKWLPDLYVGTAWYRHEGGIQLQEGPVITSSTGAMFGGAEANARFDLRQYAYQQIVAARKRIQQQGELRKLTTETLLDAANTYIDLLAARSGIAIATALDGEVEKLLKRARELAAVQPGAGLDVEVTRLEAERFTQAQTIRQLQAQEDAAAAKLAYLLGLPPGTCVVPVDSQIVQFPLVALEQPPPALVAQAMARGP